MPRWVWRAFVAAALVAAFLLLFRGTVPPQAVHWIGGVYLGWVIGQWLVDAFLPAIAWHAALVIALDLAAVLLLAWLTGGATSPWSALFGVVVLGAAFEGGWLVPAVAAVAASACWIVLGYASGTNPSPLAMLLQVSGWMLAGGAMASLVRRRALSERAAAEVLRAHRRLQRLHSVVLQAMREGVVLVDAQGRALDANPAARAMLGEDWRKEVAHLFAARPALRQALLRGRTVETEAAPDPQSLWLVRLVPFVGEGAGGAKAVLTLVDVSRVRALERRLAEEMRMAELGRMSAMLAHEIRNPLQSLRQGVELLPARSPEEREIVQILQQEVQRLARLVDSMLDFARPLAPKMRRCRPKDALQQARDALPIEDRGRVQLEADEAEAILDPDLLRIVVDNLLRNALNAGDGRIWLRWRKEEAGWRLVVEDECGGVPPALRKKLFEPFVSGRAHGIGLGLATVKRACEAAGWRIWLEDAPKGARFVIEANLRQNTRDGEDPAR